MFRTLRIAGIATLFATSLVGRTFAQEAQRRTTVDLIGPLPTQEAQRNAEFLTQYMQELQALGANVTAVDPSLGMSLRTIDDTLREHLDISKDRGLAVAEVVDNGPASKSGLKKHDVIVTVNSQPVKSIDEFRKLVLADPDNPAHLSVVRGGKSIFLDFKPDETAHSRMVLGRLDFINSQGKNYVIGVSISPADETLKTQLNIPKELGLVVDSVVADGPAFKAGLRAKDVIVTVDHRSVGNEWMLREILQRSEGKPVSIKLLRRKKPLTLEVVPVQVVFAPWNANLTALENKSIPFPPTQVVEILNKYEYFIGLPVEPLSEALPSQLNISESQGGLLTSGPAEKSPAESAGFKKNDILLKVGDEPLRTVEGFTKIVRESKGKPLTIQILREGKPQTIEVVPKKHQVFPEQPHDLYFRIVRPGVFMGGAVNQNPTFRWEVKGQTAPGGFIGPPVQVAVPPIPPGMFAPGAIDQKLDALRQQIEHLNKTVLELQKQLSKPGGEASDKK